jgi:hypothetical protein
MQNTVPCLLCGNELSPTADDISDNDIAVNMSWQGGDVAVMHCGYGSRHDLTNFLIAICDDCLEKSLQDGRIAILSYE